MVLVEISLLFVGRSGVRIFTKHTVLGDFPSTGLAYKLLSKHHAILASTPYSDSYMGVIGAQDILSMSRRIH